MRVLGAGNVHDPVDGITKVGLNAPLKMRLPESVTVKLPLFTPVPPYVGAMIVPCHAPVVTVPPEAAMPESAPFPAPSPLIKLVTLGMVAPPPLLAPGGRDN
jgi:hypothetical protein